VPINPKDMEEESSQSVSSIAREAERKKNRYSKCHWLALWLQSLVPCINGSYSKYARTKHYKMQIKKNIWISLNIRLHLCSI